MLLRNNLERSKNFPSSLTFSMENSYNHLPYYTSSRLTHSPELVQALDFEAEIWFIACAIKGITNEGYPMTRTPKHLRKSLRLYFSIVILQ